MDVAVVPFSADALPANRDGRLSERQRHNLGNMERSRQSSTRSFALVPLAIAAIILFVPGLRASALVHYGVPFVCVVVAIVLVFWASTGSDRMARDLREGKVVSQQGAVEKRRSVISNTGTGRTIYLFNVGGKSFEVYQDTYEALPPGSRVCVYYLPRSRHVVNIERVQDAPLAEVPSANTYAEPAETNNRDILSTLGSDIFAQDPLPTYDLHNVDQPTIDPIEERFSSQVIAPAEPASETMTEAPSLARAIASSWRSPMMTITFHPDGTVEAELMSGRKRSGHWSVDANGRLHFDVMGMDAAADVAVAGNHLTISVNGEGLTFDRLAS